MSDFLTRLQAAVGDTYLIERELAPGGMSRVFLAEERSLRRSVVIKVLPPEFTSEVSAARFQREILFAARLQHPHILPVLSCGDRENLLFFVTPYVAGESLRERLRRAGPFPVAEGVRVLQQVADALAYAHGEGIVHRDLKPENILLSQGHAVLMDFGVAQALAQAQTDERLTDAGLIVGTPGYMAPEQAAGAGPVDARADVYTLALVGYEILAGHPPFDGPTAQALLTAHLTRTPRPLRDVRPDVPRHVGNTIAAALTKDPEARLQSAARFRDGLSTPGLVPRPAVGWRRPAALAAVGAALVAGVGGLLALLPSDAPPLDADLVAVAPFEVLEPDLQLWREGLVDVVARDLDGIGPLRSVAPTTVVRRWSGRPDAVSAEALGRRTGAGIAVYGQVVGTGPDSVRLDATVLAVEGRRVLAQLRLGGTRARMDRLADSLTVAVLRELGRTRPLGPYRLASIGSTSLPALRAFLQGEQFFRRTDWDSALAYYGEALEHDSSFALAWRRTAVALGWQRSGLDALAREYHLRAAGLNHGLSPRDSLLLVADSLSAAMYAGLQDTTWYAHARRLYDVVGDVTTRYPEDPEAWYALGEARFHFGFAPDLGAGQRAALEAFDRAIALDSAFGPAYIHPVDLALTLEGPAAARRYIDAYLALDPKDVNAQGVRALAALLEPGDGAVADAVDSLPVEVVRHMLAGGIGRWPDSAETGRRLAQAARTRWGDSLGLSPMLPALQLAYRGHLREAFSRFGPAAPVVVLWGGMLGVLPPDTVDAIFVAYRRERSAGQQYAAGWWAARRDTAALLEHVTSMTRLGESHEQPFLRPIYRYGAGAARAYLSLARGDTADALARFEALPDSLCPWCTMIPLTRAQLLAWAGRDADAAARLRRDLAATYEPATVLWVLERGRVHERLGNREVAADAYRFVADVWRNADPELQPFAREAAGGLARLHPETPAARGLLRSPRTGTGASWSGGWHGRTAAAGGLARSPRD
jgi:eukaryotic-like serine/threonine-protein kinase